MSVVEILYENIPLTEMLSSLKVAKKYMQVYCFHGMHFTCWDLRGILETDNFVQKDSKQTLRPKARVVKMGSASTGKLPLGF